MRAVFAANQDFERKKQQRQFWRCDHFFLDAIAASIISENKVEREVEI
jgi:hypothetical protein